MTRKSWRYIVVSLVIVTTGIYLFFSYGFLSRSHPGHPDILVVEGWLDTIALEKAKAEFLDNNYKLLITTGFIYSDGYLMGSDGKTVFYTPHSGRSNAATDSSALTDSSAGTYSIELTIRGTKALDEFPHFRIYADTLEIGSSFSTRRKNSFKFQVEKLLSIDSVSVVFDNDDYSRYRDRNLYIYQLTINDVVYPANSENVSLYGIRGGKFFYRRKLCRSTATEAENYLVRSGLPDSLVVPIESLHKVKSKTYTSGLDLKKWLINQDYFGNRSVTVFSQGVHTRRTYVSFRKALSEETDLGIIACPDERISHSNWWKSLRGWKDILYETVGLIYVTVFI